jgi:Glutamyl- and glutaminyl-tRNA synthetases
MDFDNLVLPKYIRQDLANYKNKVICRFPPEPSGYLHLGHIKALQINYCVAKKYNGSLIFRIDNTNPKVETEEFVKSIIADVNFLNVKYDKLTFTSNYFDTIWDNAIKLIKSGFAYFDNTDLDKIKENRNKCIDSKFRDTNIGDNISKINDFACGKLKNTCLRLKCDMKHKNKALRDPVIYRFIETTSDNKHNIFPTYDFSCPIVDFLENITHVFRSTEFRDRDELYKFILNKLDLSIPKLYYYGKLNIKDVDLSKRKIKEAILEKKFDSWEDPRLYTLRGLLNRGYSLKGLDVLMKETNYPIDTVFLEKSLIWSINRKIIDKISARYSVMKHDQYLNGKIINFKLDSEFKMEKIINKFIKNPSLGTRKIYYSDKIHISNDDFKLINKNLTLINFGNVIYNNDDNTFESDSKNIKPTNTKLIWLPQDNVIKIKIISYSQNNNKIETLYYGENDIKFTKLHEYVQFIKMDYYMCISEFDGEIITFISVGQN